MRTTFLKPMMLVAVICAALAGCKDRDAEKKIAQLEARLAELEGKKATTPGVTPGIAPAVQPAETKPEGPLPAFEFANMEHDFGTIKEGDVVEYSYSFKNTGAAPLIIQNAQGSCGCTASDWTKEPIAVGGTGYVKAKFDSNNKANIQNKTVTVTANTWPKQTVLRFKAMVTPKSVDPAK